LIDWLSRKEREREREKERKRERERASESVLKLFGASPIPIQADMLK
jgi:hypothetical protein